MRKPGISNCRWPELRRTADSGICRRPSSAVSREDIHEPGEKQSQSCCPKKSGFRVWTSDRFVNMLDEKDNLVCVHTRNILWGQGCYRYVKVPSSPYKMGRKGTCKRIQTFWNSCYLQRGLQSLCALTLYLNVWRTLSRVRAVIRIFRVTPTQGKEGGEVVLYYFNDACTCWIVNVLVHVVPHESECFISAAGCMRLRPLHPLICMLTCSYCWSFALTLHVCTDRPASQSPSPPSNLSRSTCMHARANLMSDFLHKLHDFHGYYLLRLPGGPVAVHAGPAVELGINLTPGLATQCYCLATECTCDSGWTFSYRTCVFFFSYLVNLLVQIS
jgi:hypothetical protein